MTATLLMLLVLAVIAAVAVGTTLLVLPRLLRDQGAIHIAAARLAAEAELDAFTRATLQTMRDVVRAQRRDDVASSQVVLQTDRRDVRP